ncbi:hypothetical protein PF004_g13041 [Phytophthora fragariae]|uniref:Uncharacterized protein n=1 Tax=Phytophthora fragariae TaxID=53985 RepID=A0A6G0NTG5_9STRA|nr:hypothetical protein PF004_g13041 [Phytophthora fragariae]
MLPTGLALAAPQACTPVTIPTAPQHPDGHAASASSPANPATFDGRPGRAGGMLPVPVVHDAAQAAATTRALAAACSDAPPLPTSCAAAALTPAHVLNRPGRVGGRLAVTPLPGAAPAAVPSADQVAVQDPVQTTYAHSATEFKCSVCAYIAGNMVTLVVHRRSAHRGTHLSDIFDSGCACSLVFHPRVAATSRALACAQRASQAMLPAGEPMDVDQGRVPPSQRRASPRRPSERCPDG